MRIFQIAQRGPNGPNDTVYFLVAESKEAIAVWASKALVVFDQLWDMGKTELPAADDGSPMVVTGPLKGNGCNILHLESWLMENWGVWEKLPARDGVSTEDQMRLVEASGTLDFWSDPEEKRLSNPFDVIEDGIIPTIKGLFTSPFALFLLFLMVLNVFVGICFIGRFSLFLAAPICAISAGGIAYEQGKKFRQRES